MKKKPKHLIFRAFLLTLGVFILLMLLVSATKNEERICFLTKKITELEDVKRGFIAKALRHENQAQRLQFIDGEELEAKKHAKIAAKYQLAAKKVQQEIDQLEREKCILSEEKNDL